MDLNVSYQVTRRIALTGSINNVFNENLTQLHYSSETPDYARRSLTAVMARPFRLASEEHSSHVRACTHARAVRSAGAIF
jgi:hypothetical protein